MSINLKSLSIRELKALAKEHKLPKYSYDTKEVLVKRLNPFVNGATVEIVIEPVLEAPVLEEVAAIVVKQATKLDWKLYLGMFLIIAWFITRTAWTVLGLTALFIYSFTKSYFPVWRQAAAKLFAAYAFTYRYLVTSLK